MRVKSRTKKYKLTLSVTGDIRDRIGKLRLASGADSIVEVVRRALAIYECVLVCRSRDEKLIVTDKHGNPVNELKVI